MDCTPMNLLIQTVQQQKTINDKFIWSTSVILDNEVIIRYTVQ
jgi:hypothetical protein